MNKHEKFVRDTIKILGRVPSKQLFTVLALSKTEEGGDRTVKDLGFLGLRYLNTGSFKKTGVKREENNDYR